MSQKIVGLDLSLTATGWATVSHGEVSCDTLRTPKNLRGDARLDWLDRNIIEIVGSPRLAVIEGASFHSQSSSKDEIAGLHRIVRLAMFRRETPYILVAPIQLKKFVTGVAKAEKSMVVREVWRRWGVEVEDDNQADAVGLVQIGRGLLGELDEITEFQRDIVAKVALKFKDVLETLTFMEAYEKR